MKRNRIPFSHGLCSHHCLTFDIRNFCVCLCSVFKYRQAQRYTITELIIRLCITISNCKNRIRTYKKRHREIIMRFFLPFSAFYYLIRKNIKPFSFREIIFHFPALLEDWSHQKRIPHHVLFVQRFTCSVLREFHKHRTHHRNAFFMGTNCLAVQIRHQGTFQLCKLPHYIAGFLIKQPRYTIGSRTMETAVRTEKTKLCPSFVNICRSCLLKTTDIMAPETKSCTGQRQTTTDCFSHRRIGRRTVTAPVCRELLPANRSRPRKKNCLAFASFLLKKLKYSLII